MTPPDGQVSELVDRLARLSLGLQYRAGLNPAQWEALRYLAQANKYSRSPTALAEYLNITKGTASQTLIALEAKGLVRRVRNSADRRAVTVSVTDAGMALLCDDPLAEIDIASTALTDEERKVLLQAMGKLVHSLCDTKGAATFGRCERCNFLRCGDADASVGAIDNASANSHGDEAASSRCGLTGEFLRPEDLSKFCVDFRPCVSRG